MMTIVGNSSIFSIEWSLTKKCCDGNQYANFCFWVNNQKLGNFEEEVILSSTIKYLEIFLDNCSNRTINFLSGLTKEEIFGYIYDGVMHTLPSGENKLHESIARAEPEKIEDYRYLSQLRKIFHLDDVGGSAFWDKYNVILFNDLYLKVQRIIWRNLSDMSLHEFTIPEHYFDDVARMFLYESNRI
ncbi:Imm42 family immunity protein [Endozoicomonas numazuensis]|uniref:Uncharacterized protein n=1 Tax=Endozoicomonas numazuensis TaxID=1137799 RepID=A0A081NDM2_9GAMM|nr:Imm42 family immunity protein [Endozoicomonas numazuensis]KEQ16545.1 hypothetical protein GZ78_22145 [Endozoicomonas numazuensis]